MTPLRRNELSTNEVPASEMGGELPSGVPPVQMEEPAVEDEFELRRRQFFS